MLYFASLRCSILLLVCKTECYVFAMAIVSYMQPEPEHMVDGEPEPQSDQEPAEKPGQTTVACQTDMQSSEIEHEQQTIASGEAPT